MFPAVLTDGNGAARFQRDDGIHAYIERYVRSCFDKSGSRRSATPPPRRCSSTGTVSGSGPGGADPRRRGRVVGDATDDVPKGYQDFDRDAAKEFVLNPHGMIAV